MEFRMTNLGIISLTLGYKFSIIFFNETGRLRESII